MTIDTSGEDGHVERNTLDSCGLDLLPFTPRSLLGRHTETTSPIGASIPRTMPEDARQPDFELPESALDDSKSPGSGPSPVTSPVNPVSKNPTPISPQTLSDHVFRSFSAVPANPGRDDAARRASESHFSSQRERPASAIPSHLGRVASSSSGVTHSAGTLTPSAAGKLTKSSSNAQQGKGKGKALSIKERLKAEEQGVVKRRDGGVLARGFILKTDHYPTGKSRKQGSRSANMVFLNRRTSIGPRLSSGRRSKLASTAGRISQRLRCCSTDIAGAQRYPLPSRLSASGCAATDPRGE